MSKKRGVIVVLIALMVVALVGITLYAIKFSAIDACLDSGGKWDYENNHCLYK